jgi:YHS domain-containing protein
MSASLSIRDTVRDPVCGMEFAPEQAAVTRTVDGLVLHFCSNDCAATFDRNQAQYLAPASPTTGVRPGGGVPARLVLPLADLQSGRGASPRARPPRGTRCHARECDRQRQADHCRVRSGAGECRRPAGRRACQWFPPCEPDPTPQGKRALLRRVCARIEDALKAVPGVLDATMNAAR